MANLIEGAGGTKGGGLHIEGAAACMLDPEGLGRLSHIENDEERTRSILEYLRGLQYWPPRGTVQMPEQDEALRVSLNAEGKLDVAPAHPLAGEVADGLKQRLYRDLREAFSELAQATGNRQPDVSNRARRNYDRLPEEFAEVDLVDVYIEVAWARGEFERRGERETDDRFSAAAVAALDKIRTVGPALVLGNPDVERLEECQSRFARDPLPPDAAAAQAALAKAIAEEVDAFGDTLRNFAAASQPFTLDATDRCATVQRVLVWNVLVDVGVQIVGTAIGAPIANGITAAARWAWENRSSIEAVTLARGEMLRAWLGPVLQHAQAIAAAAQAAGGANPRYFRPPRRKRNPE